MHTFSDQLGVNLRPTQKEILAYRGGMLGISAVPGSGKTFTLSLLAAQIVASGAVQGDEEVLVVTLVNSAVDNFKQIVGNFVEQGGLIPYMGYRVRTLHGLAHDIVRMRPDLAGVSESFEIVDEREVNVIIRAVTRAWLLNHPDELDEYFSADLNDNKREWLRRDKLPDVVATIASNLIRSAKDARLSPERLQEKLQQMRLPLPLAQLGADVYADYQNGLAYRGCVDFDDLIRLALDALESDADFLKRLQSQWTYILEDEAQDSSRLQEKILRLLAGEYGNWVRVGDPNQAIYETFTTANPKYLRDFINRADVQSAELPHSGRSTQSIINLANELVKWTRQAHPLAEGRDALQAPPWIEPTSQDDPQPNPPDNPAQIQLEAKGMSPQEEIEFVVNSLEYWLQQECNEEKTVAVLVPRNQRGFDLADMLKERRIDYVDSLLRSSSSTRSSAGMLGNLLDYLAKPDSAKKLATVYRVWRHKELKQPETSQEIEAVAKIISKIKHVEAYLYPVDENEWFQMLEAFCQDEDLLNDLIDFRRIVCHWQGAVKLPIDQLLLTLAQDLLLEQEVMLEGVQVEDEQRLEIQTELALAHKLALLLRQTAQMHPNWRLPEMVTELAVIARNQRRFLGFSQDDQGFDPQAHKGKVVIATIHKAKGLEWQRVYLMAVNNYNFPSGAEKDQYISERWFWRDSLNLEAEALSQFEALDQMDEYQSYEPGKASQAARIEYVRERLRLLYVALTRAKEELVVTWNTGRNANLKVAEALKHLISYWEERENG